jgi:hypothetical protein
MLRIFFLITLVLAFGSAAQGSEPATPAPRPVTLGIFLIDILEIDSAHQTAMVDFLVRASWVDESLVTDGNETRFLEADESWTPQIQIVGDLGMRKVADYLEVTPDGTVRERIRYVGKISSRMNLYDFPLDRQIVRIELVSASRQPVTLALSRSDTGKPDDFTVADWDIGDGEASAVTFEALDRSVPSIVYNIEATRHFGYYLWKVIVPLALIVFMSWAVFWIDPGAFAPQIGAATASMLTLIAYRFALGNLVPKISYFTRMDIFITGATLMVFFALLQAIFTSRLASKGNATHAQRIDDVCRWAFPVLFLSLIVVSFVF